MPVPVRLPVVLVLTGVLAVLAMHGVAAHEFLAGEAHGGAVAGASAHHASPAPSESSGDGHGHGHGHGSTVPHGTDPCASCSGAAALCALIILAIAAMPCQARRALVLASTRRGRPPLRTWPPEPPVPKLGLVLT